LTEKGKLIWDEGGILIKYSI